MTDIANLGIAVDSSGIVDGTHDLQRLQAASEKAERATMGFSARMEAAGKKAAAANDNAARSAERAAKAYEGYSKATLLAARAMGALAGAAMGTALVRFADAWSDINARVGLGIRNMEASGAVMDRLATVARRTYSALDLTAENFVRNATVLRELGKTTAQQLDYTEALNLALVVSGAKADRAARVQESLGRAMAVGQLRGQELNTVIETGGRVAEILAEELGIGVNQLRAAGAQGKITGDILYNALTKRMVQLQGEAEKMPATIADGLTLMRNSLMQTIGVFDQSNGISEGFAKGLIAIADSMDRIVTYAATAITMLGVYYVVAVTKAYVASMTLAGGLAALRTALLRLGFTALVIAAGELVYQMNRLATATGSWSKAFSMIGDVAIEMWDKIALSGQSMLATLTFYWYDLKGVILSIWASIGAAFSKMMDGVAGIVNGMADRFPSVFGGWRMDTSGIRAYASEMQRAADQSKRLAVESQQLALSLSDQAQAPLKSAQKIMDVLAKAGAGAPDLGGGGASTGGIVAQTEKAAAAHDDLVKSLAETIKGLEAEYATQKRLADVTKAANDNVVAGALAYSDLSGHITDQIKLLDMEDNRQQAISTGNAQLIKQIEEQIRLYPALSKAMRENADMAERLKAANPYAADISTISNMRAGVASGDLSQSAANVAIGNTGLSQATGRVLNDLSAAGAGEAALGFNIAAIRTQADEYRQVISSAADASLLSAQAVADARVAIEQDAAIKIERAYTSLTTAQIQLGQEAFGSIADGVGDLVGRQSAAYRAMFALSKGFAIAQATINMWQAVSQAQKIGFPENIPLMAEAATQGGMILSNIASIAGFADGVVGVRGPGTGRSDSILARLSNGESVVTANATNKNRNTLAAMNAGASFDNGGMAANTNVRVTVVHDGSTGIAVRQLQDGNIRIIARQEIAEARNGIIQDAVGAAASVAPSLVAKSNDTPRRRTLA